MVNQKQLIKYIYRSLLVVGVLGLISACDKASNAINKISSSTSPWTLTDSVDQMSNSRIVIATVQETSKEVPLVLIEAKLICKTAEKNEGVLLELTTFQSTPDKAGRLTSLPMKFEKLRSDDGIFVTMLAITQNIVPKTFKPKLIGSVKTSIRVNEGSPDDKLYEWSMFLTEFNNQNIMYPFKLEENVGKKLNKFRISVQTTQGNPNILIDFSDTNLAKVVDACSPARVIIQSAPAPVQPAESVAAPAPAPAPAPIPVQAPVQPAESVAAPAPTQKDDLVSPNFSVKGKPEAKQILLSMLRDSLSSIKLAEAKGLIEQQPKPQTGDRKAARALNEKGLQALKLEKYSDAINLFQQSVSTDESDIEIRNNFAYALLKAKKFDEAEEEVGMVLSYSPGRSSAWANLAEIYAIKGAVREAASALIVTFQFSSNKDKTLTFLKEKSIASDIPEFQEASKIALQKLSN